MSKEYGESSTSNSAANEVSVKVEFIQASPDRGRSIPNLSSEDTIAFFEIVNTIKSFRPEHIDVIVNNLPQLQRELNASQE